MFITTTALRSVKHDIDTHIEIREQGRCRGRAAAEDPVLDIPGFGQLEHSDRFGWGSTIQYSGTPASA